MEKPLISKVATLESNGRMSGTLVGAWQRRRKLAMEVCLRLMCMTSSIVAMSLMVTAKQATSNHSSSYSMFFDLILLHYHSSTSSSLSLSVSPKWQNAPISLTLTLSCCHSSPHHRLCARRETHLCPRRRRLPLSRSKKCLSLSLSLSLSPSLPPSLPPSLSLSLCMRACVCESTTLCVKCEGTHTAVDSSPSS
ncbi:CASP-like protein [Arachis hypogaea]|nr:CASP-like protein [Arachis hypogaea]